MKWFVRLLVLFILVPALELYLLAWFISRFGALEALALIVATAVVGSAVARWQGLEALGRIRAEIRRGEVPTQSLLEGVAVLLGCALLVTPGIITDAVGLLLFVPPVRRFIAGWVKKRIKKHIDAALAAGRMTVHSTAHPLDDDAFDIR